MKNFTELKKEFKKLQKELETYSLNKKNLVQKMYEIYLNMIDITDSTPCCAEKDSQYKYIDKSYHLLKKLRIKIYI